MLKLVNYNIECGLQRDRLIKNVQSLSNEGVSIFCFQEVRKLEGQPYIGDAFLKALGPNWKAEYFLVPEFGGVGLALCIMWNSEILKLVEAQRFILAEVEKYNFWESIVLASIRSHLDQNNWLAFLWTRQKPLTSKRGALACSFNFGSSQLRVVTTHLDWAGGSKQRRRQIIQVSEYLKARAIRGPEVFCGDFNTLSVIPRFKKMSNQICSLLPKGFSDSLLKPKATCKLNFRLDYILTKGFRQASSEIINLNGSDHLPLKATLELA